MKPKVILILHDHEYNLERLLDLAGTGPVITVDAKDLDMTVTTADLRLSAEVEGYDNAEIIFFKYHGKFIPLRGKGRIAAAAGQTTFKGRLISTPALKKARIEQYVPPPAPEPEYPRYNSSYGERRYNNERSDYDRPYDRGPRQTTGDSLRTRSPRTPFRSGNPK